MIGASIANLNGCLVDETGTAIDKAVLVRAARQLLSSVTRVLLLADRVLVRHILRAEDKVHSRFAYIYLLHNLSVSIVCVLNRVHTFLNRFFFFGLCFRC